MDQQLIGDSFSSPLLVCPFRETPSQCWDLLAMTHVQKWLYLPLFGGCEDNSFGSSCSDEKVESVPREQGIGICI